jgi:hypothetical protein
VITSYYTCLETIFLRISQFFENQLNPEKWHKHLLEKMRIQINGVREQAISDDTYYLLLELLLLQVNIQNFLLSRIQNTCQ